MSSLKTHIPVIYTHRWERMNDVAFGSQVVALGSGYWLAEDLRNSGYAHPVAYFNSAAATLNSYHIDNDSWSTIQTTFGAGGGFGSGNTGVISPSISPAGSLAAGGTTTTIVLSTALPASVGIDQLANRGDNLGFIVRIINFVTGVVEERRCIRNTSGTTPTIELDTALATAPNLNDRYEFLSGSYIYLGTGALAANQLRRYDILTASLSSLSTTNLIATVPTTSNFLIATDEGYVCTDSTADRKTGEGFIVGASTYDTNCPASLGGAKKCLLAGAAAATASTITGQAVAGDAGVVANQFRNYQIRIVEDITTPTAVGQRRRIISHTAGASPVYTISSGTTNWTVTPTGAGVTKYVIENWSDNIIGFMGGATTIYNYTNANNYTGVNTANQWDTTTWAARGVAQALGAFGFHAFGLPNTTLATSRNSNIYCFRGASTTYDVLDVAGAATGSWTNGLSIVDWTGAANLDAIASSDCVHAAYNPHTQNGKYIYLTTANATTTLTYQRPFMRFDAMSRRIQKITGIPAVSGGNAFTQAKWAIITLGKTSDGSRIAFYNTGRPLAGGQYWRLWLQF